MVITPSVIVVTTAKAIIEASGGYRGRGRGSRNSQFPWLHNMPNFGRGRILDQNFPVNNTLLSNRSDNPTGGEFITRFDKLDCNLNHNNFYLDQLVGKNIDMVMNELGKQMNKNKKYIDILPVEVGKRKAIIVVRHGYGYLFKISRNNLYRRETLYVNSPNFSQITTNIYRRLLHR